jgi:hypothetical protein
VGGGEIKKNQRLKCKNQKCGMTTLDQDLTMK